MIICITQCFPEIAVYHEAIYNTFFYFGVLGYMLHITADGDCNPEIKRCLLLGMIAMAHLNNILKSRDITLSTKVRIVKATVFSDVWM